MWESTDPDAWQGEVPPEWEPEACEHPMYRMAVRDHERRGYGRDWWSRNAHSRWRGWVSERR